jgi:hypothetical protein
MAVWKVELMVGKLVVQWVEKKVANLVHHLVGK